MTGRINSDEEVKNPTGDTVNVSFNYSSDGLISKIILSI